MKSIYSYTNPVTYIKAWKRETKYSFHMMAMAAGFKTKTFLFKVLQNKKMYTYKRIKGIGVMLDLKGKELKYFTIMSFLHHSKAPRALRKEVLNKFRPIKFRERVKSDG